MGVAASGCALAAPRDRHAPLFADPKREGHSDRHGQHRGQVADHRVQPESFVTQVHVPVAPSRWAVDTTQVLRKDPPWLDPTRDVDAHVALQGSADVVRPHRRGNADSCRFVAAARVERADDLALLVEGVAALLDPARDQHVAVDAEQTLAVEACVLRFLKRADGLRLPYRHGIPSGRCSPHSTVWVRRPKASR